jgi:DNA polymerase III epsilon subunit-like protein
MPEEAFNVHGISEAFLADKPVFTAVARAFLDFVRDSKLVIHNASFDMRFLNAELEWAGLQAIPTDQAIDTLEIARRRFPGSPASLDALCRRFGIDNSRREKHGALLDSEILADVYLELIGGKQPDFVLEQGTRVRSEVSESTWRPGPRPALLPAPSHGRRNNSACRDGRRAWSGCDLDTSPFRRLMRYVMRWRSAVMRLAVPVADDKAPGSRSDRGSAAGNHRHG